MAEDYIPSLFTLRDYAGNVAREMFPGQVGAEDQLDAARHILAAATASRKYGPVWAERLGQLHEVTSSPLLALRRLLGEAPDQSYLMDTYNNQLGAQLGQRYSNQSELERAILDLVERKASPSYGAGTPVIMNKARGGLAQLQAKEGLAPYGIRHSGESAKGLGYYGPIPTNYGAHMTELSSSDDEGEYPLIVPGMTADELRVLSSGEEPTEDIHHKAQAWANMRRSRGLSPFIERGEIRMPLPEGYAHGGLAQMKECNCGR